MVKEQAKQYTGTISKSRGFTFPLCKINKSKAKTAVKH